MILLQIFLELKKYNKRKQSARYRHWNVLFVCFLKLVWNRIYATNTDIVHCSVLRTESMIN